MHHFWHENCLWKFGSLLKEVVQTKKHDLSKTDLQTTLVVILNMIPTRCAWWKQGGKIMKKSNKKVLRSLIKKWLFISPMLTSLFCTILMAGKIPSVIDALKATPKS